MPEGASAYCDRFSPAVFCLVQAVVPRGDLHMVRVWPCSGERLRVNVDQRTMLSSISPRGRQIPDTQMVAAFPIQQLFILGKLDQSISTALLDYHG